MLHPLADLSPVICRCGTELSYVSVSTQHIVFVSEDTSPYLAVVYDVESRCHSMYLIRRAMPDVSIISIIYVYVYVRTCFITTSFVYKGYKKTCHNLQIKLASFI